MSKSFLIPLSMLASMSIFAPSVFAQPPEDDLNGKTIHLYVESDDFNAFYFQNGAMPFTTTSKYKYSITLTGVDVFQQDFFFTSNGNSPAEEHFKWKFGKLGLNATFEGRFTVADFQGKDTMWVIVDPAGPISAPPVIMLEAPKTINILNPWASTAPILVWGGNNIRSMTTTPGRCGWFTTLLLDPAIGSGHFAEINKMDTYGSAGLGSTAGFDFTALFAAQGKSIWLNTQTNSWTRTWPGIDGECQFLLAAMARDFSQAHPDFDFGNLTGNYLTRGMVQATIGADRKPVSTGISLAAPLTYDHFGKWWFTDSTNANPALRSYESCIDIPMSKSSDGLWEYDSYRDSPSDHSFFPLEGPGHNKHGDVLGSACFVKPPPDSSSWVTGGPKRNGNFCLESHATFIYQPGQVFSFRGDDDIWVFINDKLVVDLGGVHTPKSESVNLDNLNLTPGREYKWDFFLCDRQPCASSLRMKTSIYFKQQRALYGKPLPGPTPGSVTMEIWKLAGGNGSCASMGSSVAETEATNLTYLLVGDSGKVVDTLGEGAFHGGITIATPMVTIDTSKITTEVLAPGVFYRVVAFDPANQALRVEIPFRVPGPATNLIRRKSPAGMHRSLKSRNALGRKVPAFPNRVHSPATFQKAPAP